LPAVALVYVRWGAGWIIIGTLLIRFFSGQNPQNRGFQGDGGCIIGGATEKAKETGKFWDKCLNLREFT
jgi:hypothetical protein